MEHCIYIMDSIQGKHPEELRDLIWLGYPEIFKAFGKRLQRDSETIFIRACDSRNHVCFTREKTRFIRFCKPDEPGARRFQRRRTNVHLHFVIFRIMNKSSIYPLKNIKTHWFANKIFTNFNRY